MKKSIVFVGKPNPAGYVSGKASSKVKNNKVPMGKIKLSPEAKYDLSGYHMRRGK